MAETTPLEDIRVNDIIARSGVSRSTFYRIFRDKYDVMTWAYQKAVQPAVTQFPELSNIRLWTYAQSAHIKAHKRFFRSIVSYRGQNSFYDFLAHYYAQNAKTAILKAMGAKALTAEQSFAIEAFSHVGAFAVVKWIRDNFEMNEDTLVDYVAQCIPDCIRSYYHTGN